eukprot:TRINITY_DN993_c0_g2_i5.p1 TRINITY_DN993_c0_g2~~TRINITY_DN993_c0_g2_i5.p1  ORF type:complete len:368 (-),score=92.51 TRINITY_DN993_c0_g2_i5:344-1447(-)
MELHIEAAKLEHLPKSCYVSVRVGEVLKQGRYEPQRCYNFPGIDRRRDARIDIYQHVGTCLVPVDPDSKASHEVYTTSTDPAFPPTKLKVNVVTRGEEVKKHRAERSKAIKGKARDYLWMHKVEERLSDAVKALLKEQPLEPFEFICNFLREKTGSTMAGAPPSQLPPLKKTSPAEKQVAEVRGPADRTRPALDSAKTVATSKPDDSHTKELELRERTQRALLEAVGNGQLDVALEEVKRSPRRSPRDVGEMKAKVSMRLMHAAEDGELDKALQDIGQDSKNGPSAQQPGRTPGEIDAIKANASKRLQEAALNGELEKVIREVQEERREAPGKKSLDELRGNASQLLAEAVSNGTLQQAVLEVTKEG